MNTTDVVANVKSKIRSVNDFPKKGIIFRDITTALKEPEVLKEMIDYLCDQFKDVKIQPPYTEYNSRNREKYSL